MAELHQYKCSCGHEVWADTRGYFPLHSGMIMQFRCKKCKDVVEVPVKDLNEHFPFFKCPECGSEHSLVSWNPVEGKCPHCGKQKMKPTGVIMNAD